MASGAADMALADMTITAKRCLLASRVGSIMSGLLLGGFSCGGLIEILLNYLSKVLTFYR